jgi:predicted nicotinamide N-methyase
VLIGDPGRPYLPHDRLVEAAVHEVADTEDAPGRPARVRRTTVWRLP